MNLWLDVGCGLHPRGDVNIDLYLESTHRRRGRGPRLNPKEIPNFIIADGEHLPLRPVFSKALCFQVIEHVPHPTALLRELYDVADHVILECPHRRYWRRSKAHIHNFDVEWFRKTIPRLLGTRKFTVKTILKPIPHRLTPLLQWPHKIRVEICA